MSKIFQVDAGGTLTTSLIAYYKLDESTGSNALDFFSTHTLTDENANTSTQTGKISGARGAFSSTQRIDTGSLFTIGETTAYSESFWLWRNASISTNQDMLCWGSGGGGGYRGYTYFDSGNTLKWLSEKVGGVNELTLDSATTIALQTWTHVMITHSTGGAVFMYINNVQVATGTETTQAATDGPSFDLGSRFNANQLTDGYIDEVGLWSKVLSTQERSDLYNGGAGQTMIDGAGRRKSFPIWI